MNKKAYDLSIITLDYFRDIFKENLIRYEISIPDCFDLIVDTFLIANVKIYLPRVFDDKEVEKEIINYIYDKNINKIRNTYLTHQFINDLFPFAFYHEDLFVNSIISDYDKIAVDRFYTQKIIYESIEIFKNEIIEVNNSYQNFNLNEGRKIKLPTFFFVSCFVHPIILIPDFYRYNILEEIESDLKNFGSDFYFKFTTEVLDLVKKVFYNQ